MDIVTRLKTIKAKECCCGCTLRTGTLILLWMILISDSIELIYYLAEIVYGKLYYRNGVDVTLLKFRAFYIFISSIVGVIVSLFGIFGIQKNIPKYLTYGYYYFLYDVAFLFLCAIVAVAKPDWHRNYILADGRTSIYTPGASEFTLIVVIMYFFGGGLVSYFAIIVRSCRDTMEKNLASARFNAMPDPAAAGYNVA